MSRLPWWQEDTCKEGIFGEIVECQQKYIAPESIKEYSKLKAIDMTENEYTHFHDDISMQQAFKAIFYAALDEGVIPATMKQKHRYSEVYTILELVWNDQLHSWDIEMNIGHMALIDPHVIILIQHLLALKYILNKVASPLTSDIVKETHRILCRESGGQYRTHEAHGNTRNYLKANKIEEVLEQFITNYNQDCQSEKNKATACEKAAKLFHNVVHIVHPFSDGNGRLGRMLVSYSLLKDGITSFAVPFNNGHRKTRSHYEMAIRNFTKLTNPCQVMELYILECVHRT